MTSAMLADLLKSLGLLGCFLIIGFILRAKISIFQKTFLPASVIGGFLLLILGPSCLNLIHIPTEWMNIYTLIPGILIVPVVTATPLGMRLGGAGEKNSSQSKNVIKASVILTLIATAVALFQFFIGFATSAAFQGMGDEFYPTFGWELGVGFTGGHGTAAMLGGLLQDAGLPYWQTAQGVSVATATFGLVGGIILGIILINWGARTGRTAILKKPADIPHNLKVGYEKNPECQESIGRETTKSSSIDTLAFHASLIFIVCTISYFALDWCKSAQIPVLKELSIWTFGLVFMFLVWGAMCKLKIDFLIDDAAKGKITGPFTEFAVIAAIASMPLESVASYIVPIVVMCVLGYIGTTLLTVYLCKRYVKGDWFEQMIVIYGAACGVFLTGVLLLRICDPKFESEGLANSSIAYAVSGLFYFGIFNLILSMLLHQGTIFTALIMLAGTIVCTLATIIVARYSYGKDFKGNP